MPGWMEELSKSSVGSVKSEKECRLSNAGEVGPRWAVGAAEVVWADTKGGCRLWNTSPPFNG